MGIFFDDVNNTLWGGLSEAIGLAYHERSLFSHTTFRDSAKETLEKVFVQIYENSRFSDPNLAAQDPLRLSFSADEDLEFDVYCEPDDDDKHDLEIHISTGALHALNDLSMRALSAEDFLNEYIDESKNLMRWQGCRTIEAEPIAEPKYRYYDYNASVNAEEMEAFIHGGYIGTYFKKIPLDENRSHLGRVLVDIALSFLVLHEESHYREGHFSYDRELSAHGKDLDPTTNKVLELQADKHAAAGVFEIFYLPNYSKSALDSWPIGQRGLFRVILTGIALAIVVLLRKEKIHGRDKYYPSPLTRFGMAALTGKKVVASRVDSKYESYFSEGTAGYKTSIEFAITSFNGLHSSIFDLFALLDLLQSESSNEGFLVPAALHGLLPIKLIAYDLFLVGRGGDNAGLRNMMIPESQAHNEAHEEYLQSLEQTKGSWMELAELTRLHNSEIYDLLGKYRKETMGSSR